MMKTKTKQSILQHMIKQPVTKQHPVVNILCVLLFAVVALTLLAPANYKTFSEPIITQSHYKQYDGKEYIYMKTWASDENEEAIVYPYTTAITQMYPQLRYQPFMHEKQVARALALSSTTNIGSTKLQYEAYI